MLEKDIKVLWGRAANRCANCRIELTLTGSATTIGEMAHIVGRSVDGPRGDSQLPLTERDRYDNLILLCPTHHREIDKDAASWSVDRLLQLKEQHEAWVTGQLDAGRLTVTPLDTSEYTERKAEGWSGRYGNRSLFVISLCPLQLEGEILNPLDKDFAHRLANVHVQGEYKDTKTSEHMVKPNPDGIGCASKENTTVGYRHHLQVDRTGYAEIVCEIQGDADRSRKFVSDRDPTAKFPGRIFRYGLLVGVVESALRWLDQIASFPLPYKDKKLTWCITSAANSNMFVDFNMGDAILGEPVSVSRLTESFVVSDDEPLIESRHAILERICNAYGLVLPVSDVENYVDNKPYRFRL